MYYTILIDSCVIYPLIYEKGFKVSEMFQKAKTELLLHASRHNSRACERKILEKQLMSIAIVGIKSW